MNVRYRLNISAGLAKMGQKVLIIWDNSFLAQPHDAIFLISACLVISKIIQLNWKKKQNSFIGIYFLESWVRWNVVNVLCSE